MFDIGHPGRLRRMVLASAVALFVLASGGTATAGPLPGSVETPCGAGTLTVPVDWYVPTTTPRALIWLQHGFARSAANVADLARHYADAGYLVFAPSIPSADPAGCTLQNVTGNTAFLAGIADLFDPRAAAGLGGALSTAAHAAGAPVPTIPQHWVFVGHSAGGEAVEYVAAQLLRRHHDLWPHLAGLVLLDPVASFVGDNTTRALADLDRTDLPILTVSGPPALCNNFGTGTAALQAGLHRPFVGVRLPAGDHTDAEGASSDMLGELLCGVPQSDDVATLQALTLGWTHDFVTGDHTAQLYPNGAAAGPAAAPGAVVLTGA